jgi:hypothetical protein
MAVMNMRRIVVISAVFILFMIMMLLEFQFGVLSVVGIVVTGGWLIGEMIRSRRRKEKSFQLTGIKANSFRLPEHDKSGATEDRET